MIGTLLVLFTLSWNPSAGATDYVVYCNGQLQPTEIVLAEGAITVQQDPAAAIRVVDVEIRHLHTCHVRARNSAGESGPSETVYPYATALQAPQGTVREDAKLARTQLTRYIRPRRTMNDPDTLEAGCLRVVDEAR